MRRMVVIELTDQLLTAAGSLEPWTLRTPDAIHLASARTLATQLSAVVTYDPRMPEAGAALGLPIQSPS